MSQGLEIGFNNRFFMDALRSAPAEKVKMELNTGISPCTVSYTHLRHLLLLALPIVGEAGLEILHLALHPVHPEHTILALELEGQDHQVHHQSEEDQSQTVGPGETVKQPGQPRKQMCIRDRGTPPAASPWYPAAPTGSAPAAPYPDS